MTFLKRLILASVVAVTVAGCSSYNDYEEPSTASYSSSPESLRYQVNNCEQEIDVIQQRVHHIEALVEEIYAGVADEKLMSREQLEKTSSSFTRSLTGLESRNKSLSNDLQSLRDHANETTKALEKVHTALESLKRNNDSHENSITHLDNALHSMMDAFQMSSTINKKNVAVVNSSNKQKFYKVKNGDTLERIARRHGTTINALKELNQLRQEDLIIIGQELILP